MSALLDASVIVRYLVGHPEEMADAAADIIDSEESLEVAPTTVAETAFVLQSFYRVPRQEIVDRLVLLLQRENVNTHGVDRGLAIQGLLLCRPSARVSFADAMLWARACASESRRVYSFDRQFPSDGIEVLSRPPAS